MEAVEFAVLEFFFLEFEDLGIERFPEPLHYRSCVKELRMKSRFRLICRSIRGGTVYAVDTQTGKRASLQTGDKESNRAPTRRDIQIART